MATFFFSCSLGVARRERMRLHMYEVVIHPLPVANIKRASALRPPDEIVACVTGQALLRRHIKRTL